MAGETFIKGNTIIFSVYSGGAWLPLGCITSSSLDESVAVDEVETKCDPGNIVKSAGSYSYDISADGIYIDEAVDTGRASHRILATIMRAKTVTDWRMTTGITVTTEEFGKGIITNNNLTGEAGSDATFSITISGTGGITDTDPYP